MRHGVYSTGIFEKINSISTSPTQFTIFFFFVALHQCRFQTLSDGWMSARLVNCPWNGEQSSIDGFVHDSIIRCYYSDDAWWHQRKCHSKKLSRLVWCLVRIRRRCDLVDWKKIFRNWQAQHGVTSLHASCLWIMSSHFPTEKNRRNWQSHFSRTMKESAMPSRTRKQTHRHRHVYWQPNCCRISTQRMESIK